MATNEHELRAAATHRESERLLQLRLEGFVGRVAEQAAIHACIAQLRPTGGYLLVTGGAGEGKSSLIAQLVVNAGVETTPHHFIALTPGRNYQLDVLRSVLAQLMLKHQLTTGYFPTDSYPALRLEFMQLVQDLATRGIEETIYLDGLDQLQPELDGSRDVSFLPLQLPAGIVIVLGSRPDEATERLARGHGLRYAVPPLSIDDAITRWQQVQPSLDLELLAQLADSLKGNALLIELAATAMRALPEVELLPMLAASSADATNLFRLSLARIQTTAPSTWQPITRPSLAVLLVSQEPLPPAVLAAILEQPVSALAESIALLVDWVSAAADQRLALRHLLFHDYLQQHELSNSELQTWHSHMADWCSAELETIWQESSDPLEQARRWYGRHHYLTHLAHAERWADLWDVVDAGAYGAQKIRFEPSTRLYGLDLDRARASVIAAGQSVEAQLELLPRLWRYSLLRTSLTSHADQWADDLFVILAVVGRVSEALSQIEICSDPARQVYLWSRVVAYAEPQRRLAILQRMEQTARSIPDAREREYALYRLALVYAESGMSTLANQIALALTEYRDYSLIGLTKIAIQQGNLRQAVTYLSQVIIVNPIEHAHEEYLDCLLMLIEVLIGVDELEHVPHLLSSAVAYARPLEWEHALGEIATLYWRLGHFEQAHALLNEVQAMLIDQTTFGLNYGLSILVKAYAAQDGLATVEALSVTNQSRLVVHALVLAYCDHNDLEKAVARAAMMDNSSDRDKAYAVIVAWYCKHKAFNHAQSIIERMSAKALQVESCCLLATSYGQDQQFETMHSMLDQATKRIAALNDQSDASGLLLKIAVVYADHAWHEAAQNSLMAAITEASNIDYRDDKAEGFKQIAEVLVKYNYAACYEPLLQAAFVREIAQESYQVRARIAQAYAMQADFKTALELITFILPSDVLIDALHELAMLAIEKRDLDHAQLVLVAAQERLATSSNVDRYGWMFCWLADSSWRLGLADLAQTLLHNAQELTKVMPDKSRWYFGQALVQSYMVQHKLDQVFSITTLIDNAHWRRMIIKELSDCYLLSGDVVQAYAMLQLVKTQDDMYVRYLSAIAIKALELRLTDLAVQYCAEAMAACSFCSSEYKRLEFYKRLAIGQIKYGSNDVLADLLTIIRTTTIDSDSIYDSIELLCEIATAYAEHGHYSQFIDWLNYTHQQSKAIKNVRHAMLAYEKIAKIYLAYAHDSAIKLFFIDMEQQAQVSIEQNDAAFGLNTLTKVYTDYAVRGHPEFFAKAYQTANRISDSRNRGYALKSLAYGYAQVDDRAQIQALVSEINQLDIDDMDFLMISELYANRGEVEFSLTLLENDWPSLSKDEIFAYLIPKLLLSNKVNAAYELVLGFFDPQEQSKALHKIITYYAELQKLPEIIKIVQTTFQTCRHSHDLWKLTTIITPLISLYPWLGTALLDEVPWVEQQLERYG
ncbi:ATP-binding protein [Herpetosiphon llansteffanensis]